MLKVGDKLGEVLIKSGLITPDQHKMLGEQRIATARRLHGFIKYVRGKISSDGKKTDVVYESPEEYVTDVED